MSVSSLPPSAAAPQISFAIACYNARPFLEDAVRSALAQDGVEVEVLIVDDGSTDGSLADAERLSREDGRVRLLRTPENRGPGGARNVAIENMRGEWYAVLDGDDLLAPGRSLALLELAQQHQADMVADNLEVFGDGVAPRFLYPSSAQRPDYTLNLNEYFARSQLFGPAPSPGYMKPMIRRSVIDRHGIRYNENLRIGEDDELVIRLLAAGCRYTVCSTAMYRYRRHSGSISHRLSPDHAQRMLDAEHGIRSLIGPNVAAGSAYRKRWASVVRGLAFSHSVEALKDRRFGDAARAIAAAPSAVLLYRLPLIARWRRLVGRT